MQASNLEQEIVNLSKVVGDFVGDQKAIKAQLEDFVGAQKAINAQLSQRIDSVESTLNKRMGGMNKRMD